MNNARLAHRPHALDIGPFQVESLRRDTLLQRMQGHLARREWAALFFANTNLVVQCAPFAPRFDDPALTLVNDGVGMDLAALARHRRRFTENLNGTDFVPLLLREAGRPLRVFLYGARPAVVVEAARVITHEHGGHTIVGCQSGYHDASLDVAALVREARPDLVLVALGNPLQERWILDHRDGLPGCLCIGVGALFDFMAGHATRAPGWVRRSRLEWLFRMAREPRRLWRRYTLDALKFFRISLARA